MLRDWRFFKLPSRPQYSAFWSYTRFDDDHDGNWLTDLRKAIEQEVRSLSAVDVKIFQDIEGIKWGEKWGPKIKMSEDDAIFLIPIITPNFFKSNPCRSELWHFVEREKATPEFDQLVLPLYNITAPQLEIEYKRGADFLAQEVSAHNYEDIRSERDLDLDSSEGKKMVRRLAANLFNRLTGFAQWRLGSKEIEVQIKAPASGSHVPRRFKISGTLHGVSEWVEVWMVVDTGSRYHPQAHLPRDSATWEATAIIGREGTQDANHRFKICILGVTEDRRY